MKKHILIRTNAIICFVVLIGYLITSVLSYQANYEASIVNIEQITTLSSEGIYFQLTSTFAKPVNVSLTMANDSLLKQLLTEESLHANDEEFVKTLKTYLNAYRQKYAYDSVFLVSTATGVYYNFEGIDRVLKPGNPENDWYYSFLENDIEHSLNIDNDEAANNEITVFVNCKIRDAQGKILGIVGVGQRIDSLQALLKDYEQKFGVGAYLLNEQGFIEISTQHTGYEQYDFFETMGKSTLRDTVLKWKESETPLNIWASDDQSSVKNDFLVTRYLPDLSWYLLVERDTGALIAQIRQQLFITVAIIVLIILVILLVITYVIRGFNRQILLLTRQKEKSFRTVTEQLYDSIYEINVTENRAEDSGTNRYFESLGISKYTPYDQALPLLVERQVKKEFHEGYIATFHPQNILQQFEEGNRHLQYEFMARQDDQGYCWMRIDAYLYRREDDNSIHMFTYHKNIDVDVRRKEELAQMTHTDPMTQFYNKEWTHQMISQMLEDHPQRKYAFFIFDIDNFKQANDLYGHAFGDYAIIEFTDILRQRFRSNDILGRIGGDEFVAFIPIPDENWVLAKVKELSNALDKQCCDEVHCWKMAGSIGVAMYPMHGDDFDTLYRNADFALYQTKRCGKNGYTIFQPLPVEE